MRVSLAALLATALTASCSVQTLNRVGLASAVASTACDGGSTMLAASRGWRSRAEGGTPAAQVMGTQPTSEEVGVYFAFGTLALVGAAQLVPERYRWLAYGLVTVGEGYTAYGNVATTGSLCGLQ